MAFGNQYLYFDPSTGWVDGFFQLNNTSAPTTITFSNNDFNLQPLFPLSTTFTGTVAPPAVTVGFYTASLGTFAFAARLAFTPVSTTSTTTTYTVQNYTMAVGMTFNPFDNYTMLFRYPEPGFAGPTGPVGSVGATGSASTVTGPTGAVSTTPGPTGPTGAPPPVSLASLRAAGGAQNVSNNTATAVTLDTVDIATTDSANLTTNTSTGLITCVTTGVYEVTGRVNWTSTIGGGVYQLRILANGTSVQAINTGVVTPTLGSFPTDNGETITSLVNVTSGNTTIGLQVNQNSGATQALSGSGTVTSYLFVRKLT